jgi:hypothetical protein
MGETFVAAGQGRPDALDLHRAVPIARGRHRALVAAEADEGRLVAEFFATELTDIQLVANRSHLSVPGVADMGVMGPHHRLGGRSAPLKKLAERVEHMPVAQVPARRTAPIHGAVVGLRILDEPGVLSRVQEGLVVLRRIVIPAGEQVRQG